MRDTIDKAFDITVSLLKKVDGDIERLKEPISTFLIVYSAQGVIDNGGFYYFFESNWPNSPPYEQFINAYRKIGCIKQAELLEKIVNTFNFDNPHLNQAKRLSYMNELLNEETNEVSGWGDDLCGDEEVWFNLESYYLGHKNAFA